MRDSAVALRELAEQDYPKISQQHNESFQKIFFSNSDKDLSSSPINSQ